MKLEEKFSILASTDAFCKREIMEILVSEVVRKILVDILIQFLHHKFSEYYKIILEVIFSRSDSLSMKSYSQM